MIYGAHLPLIGPPTDLGAYARQAAALGYDVLCANDHLLFRQPWLDGPTALASVIEASGAMTLATTVALPVIRGPVQTAKLLGALDLLSGGRLIAGVGPGSSRDDYAAVAIPFEERWPRFDAAVGELRSLLGELEPRPVGAPLWVASWGSDAGMRRVARLGDGWLASGYNTTPEAFAQARTAVPDLPNAIATMWLYVTESRAQAERRLEALAALLGRPVDALRGLPIGSAEHCAERIAAFAQAGAERIFVWPLADELDQLERFREAVGT